MILAFYTQEGAFKIQGILVEVGADTVPLSDKTP